MTYEQWAKSNGIKQDGFLYDLFEKAWHARGEEDAKVAEQIEYDYMAMDKAESMATIERIGFAAFLTKHSPNIETAGRIAHAIRALEERGGD